MLNALKRRRRIKRLRELIDSNTLDLWPKLAPDLQVSHLYEPLEGNLCALELCIERGHHTLMQQLLHRFPELCKRPLPNGQHLVERVLAEDASLAMLSALLGAGMNPNLDLNNRSLVELALEQPSERAMLLINRLAQHGASLNHPILLQRALKQQNQALVKFMIDSGAALVMIDESVYNEEILAFAKRCIEDKKIRDLWA